MFESCPKYRSIVLGICHSHPGFVVLLDHCCVGPGCRENDPARHQSHDEDESYELPDQKSMISQDWHELSIVKDSTYATYDAAGNRLRFYRSPAKPHH